MLASIVAVGTGRAARASQAEMAPRLLAGAVTRHARPADIGPHRIDRARGRSSDGAEKGRAARTGATHAALAFVDELGRDARKIGLALEGEPWPIRRIGTARPATPAHVVRVCRLV